MFKCEFEVKIYKQVKIKAGQMPNLSKFQGSCMLSGRGFKSLSILDGCHKFANMTWMTLNSLQRIVGSKNESVIAHNISRLKLIRSKLMRSKLIRSKLIRSKLIQTKLNWSKLIWSKLIRSKLIQPYIMRPIIHYGITAKCEFSNSFNYVSA